MRCKDPRFGGSRFFKFLDSCSDCQDWYVSQTGLPRTGRFLFALFKHLSQFTVSGVFSQIVVFVGAAAETLVSLAHVVRGCTFWS